MFNDIKKKNCYIQFYFILLHPYFTKSGNVSIKGQNKKY